MAQATEIRVAMGCTHCGAVLESGDEVRRLMAGEQVCDSCHAEWCAVIDAYEAERMLEPIPYSDRDSEFDGWWDAHEGDGYVEWPGAA